MRILVLDVGGTHVKALMTGQSVPVMIESGPKMTPSRMVKAVKAATQGWGYDVIAIGIPAPVIHGHVLHEPYNLGAGWVGYDFAAAFGKPVKLVNDAVMQAIGSYHGGRLLFLGLGTGLGAAVIDGGVATPLEIAHLPYKKSTYEGYVGEKALKRVGRKRWRERVIQIADELNAALVCDNIVLGGGNARLLESLPPHASRGDNANAFLGGFRLWDEASVPGGARSVTPSPSPSPSSRSP